MVYIPALELPFQDKTTSAGFLGSWAMSGRESLIWNRYVHLNSGDIWGSDSLLPSNPRFLMAKMKETTPDSLTIRSTADKELINQKVAGLKFYDDWEIDIILDISL